MNELMERIEAASAQLDVRWGAQRAHTVERKMLRRKSRRARVRAGMAVVATLVVIVAVGVTWKDLWSGGVTQSENVAHIPDLPVIRLQDGSVAAVLNRESALRVTQESPSRVVIDLVRGGARFEVTRKPSRIFEVQAGQVAVLVVGTRFMVERQGGHVSVTVDDGRVRVTWPDGSKELGRGDAAVFPPEPDEPPHSGTATSSQAPLPAASGSASALPTSPPVETPTPVPVGPDWRALASRGEYKKAYEVLERDGKRAIRDDPTDLLLAADVARLSGHPGQAVAYLQQLLRNHRGDARASLAAFTLGRILLDQLGRPSQAARAFSDAQRLGLGGALAQDALAREVEALSKAGSSERAKERALVYVKRFPNGHRIKSVRSFGGLE